MKEVINLFNLKSLLLVPIVACLFSIGCTSNVKRLNNELALKDEMIRALEEEKNNVFNDIEKLKNRETVEINRLKGLAEYNLSGTGVNVKVKEDEGVISLMLPSSSYFDPGKAKLKGSAKAELKDIARLLKKHFYNNRIRIEGHTDNQPIKKKKDKYKTNWELSAARAISVLYYFIEDGSIGPEKMYIAGFGEFNPISSNSTKEGRKKNRRVEIVIIP